VREVINNFKNIIMRRILKPYEDIVVIKQIEAPELTAKGIFLPTIDKEENVNMGIVVSVGDGRTTITGNFIPIQTKIGDKVMYKKFGTFVCEFDDETYHITKESELIMKIFEKERTEETCAEYIKT
jgi:chaperonin GroES